MPFEGGSVKMREFTNENTSGFTEHEIDEMNVMLSNMLMSDELGGIEEKIRAIEKAYCLQPSNVFSNIRKRKLEVIK